MNFCSSCGQRVALQIPDGDNRHRYVCGACSIIHYQNPKMVVGAIPEWGSKILLCRRAIEPRHGKWTLPAGFMENGESTAEAAARETLEEANARVEMGPIFSVISVPHVDQVHIFYRARLLDLNFSPGTESLEVELFEEQDIPWREVAFRTVTTTLERYFHDRGQGTFQCHTDAILPVRPTGKV
ncbi:MAG: NUDIX domain-containing protein [Betaproteobacteria bacterium]|nr:NUDIX domain-containing protein [Betaproteobacteria bacterium]